MPTYRPKINKENLKQLEHYRFRLAEYCCSSDFKHEISCDKQRRLLYELSYVDMCIRVAKDVFSLQGTEIPIVGWQEDNPNKDDGYMKIYHFTSATLAAKILNLNTSKVTAVCKGNRLSTGGHFEYDKATQKKVKKGAWCFKYLSDYNEEDEIVGTCPFDPYLPFYEILKI